MKKKSIGIIIAAFAILFAVLMGILEASSIIKQGSSGTVTVILVILGLLLGALNIKSKESVPFMISALVIGGGAAILASLPLVGRWVEIIFGRIATLIIPAAIVVSLVVAYRHLRN